MMNVFRGCVALFCLATVAFLPRTSSLELRAVFDMSGIKGDVTFTQTSSAANTTIKVNLTGLTRNYAWYVHMLPVVYRGNVQHTCGNTHTGETYDPTNKKSNATYASQCNNSMAGKSSACAVGDLTGKHGHLATTTYTTLDPNLPLSGPRSIFGRSLVLFDKSSAPVACALIDAADDVVTAVATFRGQASGVTGTVTLRQSRLYPSLDSTVDVNLFYSNSMTSGSKNLILSISDKKLPDEGVPSYEGSICPTNASNGRVISGNVDVPLATNGPSTERFLLIVKNIFLSGSKSDVGKTLVLWENGSPKICASVYELLPMEAEGSFDVDGVKGKIHFKQDSELSPTVVTADVKGLGSKAKSYHVHVYKVQDSVMVNKRNTRSMCGSGYLAGHWNPYGTTSANPGNGTVDQYEIGDLSGKYGTISNLEELSFTHSDYNLPLFGKNSILYRSLVIHYKNNSRWMCTNIFPKDPTFHFKAESIFQGPDFNGTISVEQASFIKRYAHSHVTTFFLQLESLNKSVKSYNHKWHIHQDRVTVDQMWTMGKRCKSPLAHYNPYSVSLKANYSANCSPKNLLRCELGDLSSKLSKYDIGGGKKRFTESENYFAGLNSILGRSIVVHAKDSEGPRLGCASLQTNSSSFVKKELTFMHQRNNNTDDFRQSLAEALDTKKWRIANVQISKFKNCLRANFIIIESNTSNLKSKYEGFKGKWPQNLKTYTPVTDAECIVFTAPSPTTPPSPTSDMPNLQATYLILILAFSLLCMFT